MTEQDIENLLDKKFQEKSFADCFLVEIKIHQNNKIVVFIDSDSGLTLNKCHTISRYLESYFDELECFGEKYVLEVSSPGIGRPLSMLRQYKKNIGRKIAIELLDGEKKTGVLKAVSGTMLLLEEKIILKEGKRKKRTIVTTEIPHESIKKAVVKAAF